jgi:hypothetical protein
MKKQTALQLAKRLRKGESLDSYGESLFFRNGEFTWFCEMIDHTYRTIHPAWSRVKDQLKSGYWY